MGNLEQLLQEKVKKRNEKKSLLKKEETLEEKGQKLANAVRFLEKTASEGQKDWLLEANKPIEGQGFFGKLQIFRKKAQRKALHWYIEPVCEDQSAYNRKMALALEAFEEFAKAQEEWNQAIRRQRQQEAAELRGRIAELEEEVAELKGRIGGSYEG